MFKTDKTKRFLLIAAIVFVVIYAILYLMIQAGYDMHAFSAILKMILDVLTPVIAGGLIAYLLNPILRFWERKVFKKMKYPRVRRALSVFLTYLLVILLLVGIFSAILPQVVTSVQEFGSNIENYANALQTAISSLFDDLNNYIDAHPSVRNLLESMHVYDWIGKVIEEESGGAILPPTINGAETGIPGEEVIPPDLSQKHELSFEAFSEFLMEKLSSLSSVFTELIASFANSILDFGFAFVNFLKNILLGIFISIYLLLSKERVAAQCKRFVTAFFPLKTANEIIRISRYSDKTVGRFMLGTIIDAVIVALLTLFFLTVFKIKYALLISLIIGVTNMIPFFGPFIGSIPSAILLFIDDITYIINNPDEPVRFSFLTFILIILVIQQIDGNIINPRIIGDNTGLSSLGVILSVTIMSGFFGFFGMLLGVPVAAIIVGLGKEITENRLKKKSLPVTVAEYYSENSMVPPETPEEEQEHHEHTAFYRMVLAIREKMRHAFRKKLYRKNKHSRSLRMWVNMKLGVRSVRQRMDHVIHPEQRKTPDEAEAPADEEAETEESPESTSDETDQNS